MGSTCMQPPAACREILTPTSLKRVQNLDTLDITLSCLLLPLRCSVDGARRAALTGQ
jgi:hypothetical protein